MSTPLDKYRFDEAIAILLLGENGTGKSTFCLQWPAVWVLDCDQNLGFPIENRMRVNPGELGWLDKSEVDESGPSPLPVESKLVWQRCCDLVKANGSRPEVKTIVIDSLTRLCLYLKISILESGTTDGRVVGGERMMTKNDWDPFQQRMSKFLMDLRALGKPVIMTAHLKSKMSKAGEYLGDNVAIQGTMDRLIGGYFNNIWQTDVATVGADGVALANPIYFVRTRPTATLKTLKHDCDPPAEFVFTWRFFSRHMEWRKLVRTYRNPSPALTEAQIKSDLVKAQSHLAPILAMPEATEEQKKAKQAALADKQPLVVKLQGLVERFKPVPVTASVEVAK